LQSINKEKNEKEEEEIIGRSEIKKQSPLYSFMYALKSSEARRRYPKMLKMLFDFIGLPGFFGGPGYRVFERSKTGYSIVPG
jgi:hypothetical protein